MAALAVAGLVRAARAQQKPEEGPFADDELDAADLAKAVGEAEAEADGGVPAQPAEIDRVPAAAAKGVRSRASPEIVGSTVFTGGSGGTAAVGSEDAVAEPPPFAAVTATRSLAPMSALRATYVEEVAPASSLQTSPVRSQRSHW